MKLTYFTVSAGVNVPFCAILAQKENSWYWLFSKDFNKDIWKTVKYNEVRGIYNSSPLPTSYIVKEMSEESFNQFVSEHFDELL